MHIILDYYEVVYENNFDGVPSFSSTECIMVRCVTKYLQIIELVFRVGLFKNSLNAGEKLNRSIDTINITLVIEVKFGLHQFMTLQIPTKQLFARLRAHFQMQIL